MRFQSTELADAWLVLPERHADDRGFFVRTFCEDEFGAHGLPTRFPQSNDSHNSRAGTLRGMHLNLAGHWESKLVRCSRGAIFDVIIDVRPTSPTRDQWLGVELTAENGVALFVPEGFAHGFLTLADDTIVSYQMGRAYEPGVAVGFRWDDPKFEVRWPMTPTVIAERDATYPDYDPTALGLWGVGY